MKYLILTDTHLKSKRFKHTAYLHELLSCGEYDFVIGAGDIFDQYRYPYMRLDSGGKLIAEDLCELGPRFISIFGNHEPFLSGTAPLYSREDYIIQIGNKRIKVMHGHQLSKISSGSMFWSALEWLFCLFYKWIEVLTGLNILNIIKNLNMKRNADDGTAEEYISYLTNFKKRAYNLHAVYDGVIMGHTHLPELISMSPSFIYANAGSWVCKDPSWIEIEDSKITLRYMSGKYRELNI